MLKAGVTSKIKKKKIGENIFLKNQMEKKVKIKMKYKISKLKISRMQRKISSKSSG